MSCIGRTGNPPNGKYWGAGVDISAWWWWWWFPICTKARLLWWLKKSSSNIVPLLFLSSSLPPLLLPLNLLFSLVGSPSNRYPFRWDPFERKVPTQGFRCLATVESSEQTVKHDTLGPSKLISKSVDRCPCCRDLPLLVYAAAIGLGRALSRFSLLDRWWENWRLALYNVCRLFCRIFRHLSRPPALRSPSFSLLRFIESSSSLCRLQASIGCQSNGTIQSPTDCYGDVTRVGVAVTPRTSADEHYGRSARRNVSLIFGDAVCRVLENNSGPFENFKEEVKPSWIVGQTRSVIYPRISSNVWDLPNTILKQTCDLFDNIEKEIRSSWKTVVKTNCW